MTVCYGWDEGRDDCLMRHWVVNWGGGRGGGGGGELGIRYRYFPQARWEVCRKAGREEEGWRLRIFSNFGTFLTSPLRSQPSQLPSPKGISFRPIRGRDCGKYESWCLSNSGAIKACQSIGSLLHTLYHCPLSGTIENLTFHDHHFIFVSENMSISTSETL